MTKWKIVSTILLSLSILSTNASAQEGFSWYTNRTGDDSTPALGAEQRIILEHDAFYVNESVKSDEKVLYLTFDMGYINENAWKIVKTLEEKQAHGAFFILSHTLSDGGDMVKALENGGHLICNHSSMHPDMTACGGEEEFRAELSRLEAEYTALTGKELDPFFRPPQGRYDENTLIWAENMGYSTVFWSFAYADWDNDAQPDGEKAVELILKNTHNGMIILLHPTSKTNAEILPILLEKWEEMGYRFGSLTELSRA